MKIVLAVLFIILAFVSGMYCAAPSTDFTEGLIAGLATNDTVIQLQILKAKKEATLATLEAIALTRE